jgi:hypothetical protein
MADEHQDEGPIDAQEVLRTLEDVRSRLRTTIWALHGMHQDVSSLTVDDLSDHEHLLTETLDHLLSPAYEAVSQMLARPRAGPSPRTEGGKMARVTGSCGGAAGSGSLRAAPRFEIPSPRSCSPRHRHPPRPVRGGRCRP